MRKFVVLVLALLVGAASMPATADHYYYRNHRHSDRGAYVAGGVLLGLLAGAAIANDRHDRRYYPDRYDYGYYDGGYYGGGYYDRRYYGGDYYYDSRPYRRDVIVYRDVGPRYYRHHYYDHGYHRPHPRHYDRYDRRRHHHHGW
jgi:hypothetical protein